jgi:ABC-type transporter Mla subunit MlaD
MSNEEVEKRMEFILEQQAQFASNMQVHDERFAQLESVLNRLAAVTLEGFKDVNAKIDALVDSNIRLSEAQARTEANQARTDEALRNLIAVVDRYFSEGRGRTGKNSDEE